jgi:hypothetical protein
MICERASDERANYGGETKDSAEQAEQARAVLEAGGLCDDLEHSDD